MKYYLVNFLVCDNNTIIEDSTITLAVGMDVYDYSGVFKKLIIRRKKYKDADIVIKMYRQVSEDIFLMLHPFIKQNPLVKENEETDFALYPFDAGFLSRRY